MYRLIAEIDKLMREMARASSEYPGSWAVREDAGREGLRR